MMDGRHLAKALAEPSYVLGLDARGWNALLTMARSERLDATLGLRLAGLDIPPTARAVLDGALAGQAGNRTTALWEAEMALRALSPHGIPVILLKGAAFVAAGLDAGLGRRIGDLDILVPRDRLDDAESALLKARFEWVKDDPYDQAYYRDHMHELPPLIHRDRDQMIDVHHTILPLTARPRPDAAALVAASIPADPAKPDGVRVLCPQDMIIHAVAHLFADGDMEGGMRNLWDIDRLVRQFGSTPDFWPRLIERARLHQLAKSTSRALRLTRHLYGTPVDSHFAWDGRRGDIFYLGRILARNGWGQQSRKLLRFAFYVRSHWIRMPPLMLAKHLARKWWKARKAEG
jgi:Uncharacterised nucleotidyltransferase